MRRWNLLQDCKKNPVARAVSVLVYRLKRGNVTLTILVLKLFRLFTGEKYSFLPPFDEVSYGLINCYLVEL